MIKVLSWLTSRAGWLLASFVLVVIILALVDRLPHQLSAWKREAERSRLAFSTLAAARPALEIASKVAINVGTERIDQLRDAGVVELARARADIAIRRKEAAGRVLEPAGIAFAAARGDSAGIVGSYRARYVELPLLDQAAALAAARVENLKRTANFAQQRTSLDGQIVAHNQRVAAFRRRAQAFMIWQRQAKAQRRDPICMSTPIWRLCDYKTRIAERKGQLVKQSVSLRNERAKLEAARSALQKLRHLQREMATDTSHLSASAIGALNKATVYASSAAKRSVWNNVEDAFGRYGWAALWIVVGGILLPVFHKAFAFLVIAPLATRAAPVRISPPGTGANASRSAVSIDVPIDQHTELLVRAGVQDRPAAIEVGDKCLLDNWMPFACIAAGLVNLQRFRSKTPGHVAVSGTDGDHYEVALIEVPEGGAVVLQPRALVGVLKPLNRKLRIERPWRLRWLISWITCQFRYIVFHGPCTLVVQGRRGIRVKNATDARAINKRLVLGFDAGLAYSAARSGSFRPYLFGQASLFDDRFSGAGSYIYEERPAGLGKGSIWGRGLKGIGDAILSALGI